MNYTVNYVFVRHGHSCHNAVNSLASVYPNVRATPLAIDPTLSQIGVDTTFRNGCIIGNILPSLKNGSMKDIHIVGCSPLIRSMETAYFMTRTWATPPKKIYIFPFLREIDENSLNKFSPQSINIINSHPSYALSSIESQKQYLASLGILDNFDFSYVDTLGGAQDRMHPGDIDNFKSWCSVNVLPKYTNKGISTVNALIVTHAGVLKDYAQMSFPNNSGFLVSETVNKNDKQADFSLLPLTGLLNDQGFYNASTNRVFKDILYYCPSKRCGGLCPNLPSTRKRVDAKCISSKTEWKEE
jgi:hypothetical protein